MDLNAGTTLSCGCLRSCSKKGSKNPQWKGGRTMVNGYVQIKKPEHHRSNNQGYTFEHVLVAENTIGRNLYEKETVHHINQNRSDNRPQNLFIFDTPNAHISFHKRKYPKEGKNL